jgi:hypothetical protein
MKSPAEDEDEYEDEFRISVGMSPCSSGLSSAEILRSRAPLGELIIRVNFTPENFGAAVGLPLFVFIRVHSRLSFVPIRGPGLAQSMLRSWPTE